MAGETAGRAREVTAAAKGALAGSLATSVMTAAMVASQRLFGGGKLGPKRITEEGAPERLSEATTNLATTFAHFGFGSAMGALFAVLERRIGAGLPVTAKALIYANLLWAASYAGWVPALGILPPPRRDDPRRMVPLYLTHWVYGLTLGGVLRSR